jgi:hypothetical protein
MTLLMIALAISFALALTSTVLGAGGAAVPALVRRA